MGELRKIRTFFRDRRGVSAIEFGFIAPILMLLTVGIIDFGRFVWLDTTLDHAAKEAARYASVRGGQSLSPATQSEITTYIQNRAVGVPTGDLNVSVTWTPNNNSGSSVSIVLTYEYSFLLKGFLPIDTYEMEGQATMVIL